MTQRGRFLPVNQFYVAEPIVGVDATYTLPDLWRDCQRGALGVAVFGELRYLVETKAISVDWATTLTGANPTIFMLKHPSGTPIEANIGRNWIARMEVPLPSEGVRIKKQEAASPRCGLRSGRGHPPEAIMLPNGGIDILPLE